MAIKSNEKTEKVKAEIETATPTEAVKAVSVKASKTMIPKEQAGFCVYIGPTIQGAIQSGTVMPGTKERAVRDLARVIEKHPLVERLIVADKTFAEDRMKVKQAGNQLFVVYHKLIAGLNI